MRKIIILCFSVFLSINTFAQSDDVLYEKPFNIGLDVFNTFWMDLPEGVSQKGLNIGYSVYGMYNYRFNTSLYSFAGGLGVSIYNLASNSVIEDVHADVITLTPIPDDVSYDRSKLSFSYFDLPLELRYKSEKQFRLAFGFRIGFRLDNHLTYKGDRLDGSATAVTVKEKGISNVEKIALGTTFRIGYKWLNLNVYYSLTNIFEVEKGPEFKPFSIGFTFIPF